MSDRIEARRLFAAFVALLVVLLAAPSGASAAREKRGLFSFGELQSKEVGAAGCGENAAGEPAIHVSRAGNVFLGSELGIGGGSELWRGLGATGGIAASGCGLEFRGQPNAVEGHGDSGGDIDIAIANATNPQGNYNVYVSSLNLSSVNVAHSTDNGTTFSQSPVQAGLPGDDREWIAAFGAETSLLSFHSIVTNNIEILRSENAGATYTKVATAIPLGDYKERSNELGNLVIDHRNLPAGGGFYAYQAFVAPSGEGGEHNNEAFLAVSQDGGTTWTDRPIPCSTAAASTDLDHNFPNVSVAPNGDVWYAWSDDHTITTAVSRDHGTTWECSNPVSKGAARAIFPWLVATSKGVDLVYYAEPSESEQLWYVDFAQNRRSKAKSWAGPHQLFPVHKGEVCEGGIECTNGRQLFDDFGVDTDAQGWAHIAYSHDSPELGGEGTYTGYAVQTRGRRVGEPND